MSDTEDAYADQFDNDFGFDHVKFVTAILHDDSDIGVTPASADYTWLVEEVFEIAKHDDWEIETIAQGPTGEKLYLSYSGEIQKDFADYLRDEVFTRGGYVIEDTVGGAKVAEMDDGMGYTIGEDLRRAADDDNVTLHAIHDGWLKLKDDR